MKHYCPMCGDQWNEDRCVTCGWGGWHRTRAAHANDVCISACDQKRAIGLPHDPCRVCRERAIRGEQ